MDKITEIVASALNALYGVAKENPAIQLQKTKKEFEGNLTLVVFPFLKDSKRLLKPLLLKLESTLLQTQS